MFVNVPLAKENHMIKFRFKVGRGKNRLYLLKESDSAVTFYVGLHFESNNVAILINNLPRKQTQNRLKM